MEEIERDEIENDAEGANEDDRKEAVEMEALDDAFFARVIKESKIKILN